VAIDDAVKILGEAVLQAIRSEGPLQVRLFGCCLKCLLVSHHDHLPPDLKERLDVIMTACTREPDPSSPPGSSGGAAITTGKMDDEEAYQWLGQIFLLYTDVAALEQREKIAREILAVRP
jgi:hypothetical protein